MAAVQPTSNGGGGWWRSRKLLGLALGLAAILLLAVVATVAMIVWELGWQLYAALGGIVGQVTSVHLGAQAAADRSPNYPGQYGWPQGSAPGGDSQYKVT